LPDGNRIFIIAVFETIFTRKLYFIMKKSLTVFLLCSLLSCNSETINEKHTVEVVGEMRNVMWKGELEGIISIDSLKDYPHLYGLGPLEYLKGEILIIDGKSFISKVVSDSTMTVEEDFDIKAPFFAYSNIKEWEEVLLSDTILNISQLETFLDTYTDQLTRPFLFKLTGTADSAIIHVVNLPEGTKVNSPQEAHQGQINYSLTDAEFEIVGFFSTSHQSIFTHHDTYLHMHLITSDKNQMGHLDEISFRKGSLKLFLPKGL
jgi:acetolactate decarboxylase